MPCKTCARLTLTLSQQFFTFTLFFYSSKYVFLLLKANKCFWALFSVLEQECLLRKKRKKTAEIKKSDSSKHRASQREKKKAHLVAIPEFPKSTRFGIHDNTSFSKSTKKRQAKMQACLFTGPFNRFLIKIPRKKAS